MMEQKFIKPLIFNVLSRKDGRIKYFLFYRQPDVVCVCVTYQREKSEFFHHYFFQTCYFIFISDG